MFPKCTETVSDRLQHDNKRNTNNRVISQKKKPTAKNELKARFRPAAEREYSMWLVTPASQLTGLLQVSCQKEALNFLFSFQLLPLGLTTERKEWQICLVDVFFMLHALPDTNLCTKAQGGNLFAPRWSCIVGVTWIELCHTHTDQRFLQC